MTWDLMQRKVMKFGSSLLVGSQHLNFDHIYDSPFYTIFMLISKSRKSSLMLSRCDEQVCKNKIKICKDASFVQVEILRFSRNPIL